MNTLSVRLMVNVLAMALVGLSLVDVAFVFWAQQQIARVRRADLFVAVARLVPELVAGADADAAVQQVEGDLDLDVTLQAMRGSGVYTRPVSLPPELPERMQVVNFAGREHLVVPLSMPMWRRLVVSRRADDVLTTLGSVHERALAVLSAALLLMLLAGWAFLRRTVLAPLQRLTDIVQPREGDDLSHAVIAMVHTLREDRQRIAAQLQALELAQNQLVRAERLAVVGRLAAGVAHEVGNPLAVLQGFVELLQHADLPQVERDQALQRMTQELGRLHRTVRQLLDFSRVPGDHDAPGDVTEAMHHTRELLRPQARLRDVELRMIPPPGPAPVRVSTDALIQVMLNLVLNAADALNGRGVVTMLATPRGSSWQLQVEDSGPGVDPNIAAHIFEPFFTTKAAGVGTGLGLAVCERIITAAGGDIVVGRSKLGGACFTLTLPAPTTAPGQ